MKRLLAMALLLAPVPAAAATRVEVADGNWSYLPLMKQRGSDHLNNDALARIDEIIHEKKCTFPGQQGPITTSPCRSPPISPPTERSTGW